MQMIQVTAEEIVAAFQEQWPTQYEITALRVVNQAQANRIAELEVTAALAKATPPAAASEFVYDELGMSRGRCAPPTLGGAPATPATTHPERRLTTHVTALVRR
jgi:hypothetical protein